MANAESLVLRSDPLSDERLPGYLLRLSGLNGFRSPAALLPYRKTAVEFRCPSDSGALSTLLGILPAQLEALSYDRSRNSVLVASGFEVSPREFSWYNCKVCPECLIELRYVPWVWDLAYYQVCDKHFCWLRDVCENCEKPLAWFRPDVDICRCGADLSKQKTRPCPPAEALLAALIGRASGRYSPVTHADEDPFRSLNFGDLLDSIGQLAHIGLQAINHKWRTKSSAGGACRQRYILASDLIANWPCGLINSIFDIIKLNRDTHVGTLFKRKLLAQMSHKSSSSLGFLSKEIVQIRDRYRGMTFVDIERLGLPLGQIEGTISRNRFLKDTSITEMNLKRLESSGTIQFSFLGERRTKYRMAFSTQGGMLDVESLSLYSKYANEWISRNDAMALFGLKTWEDDSEFSELGLIHKSHIGLRRGYSRSYIEQLLNDLDALALDIHEAAPSEATFHPTSIGRAVRLALDRELPLVRVSQGSVGLARYALLDKEGLIRFDLLPHDFASRERAAKYLQTTVSTVKNLLTAKLLRRHRVVGRLRAREATLSRLEVEAFSDAYLLREHLARMLNWKPKLVATLLREHGFESIVCNLDSSPQRRVAVWDRKTMDPWFERQEIQAPVFHW